VPLRPPDRLIERRHRPDTRYLSAGHQVGVAKVEAVDLVQLDGPQQEVAVEDGDRVEREDGPWISATRSRGTS
jgi:hypothetical protein